MKNKKIRKFSSPLEKTIFTGKKYCWGCWRRVEKEETYCANCGSFNYL